MSSSSFSDNPTLHSTGISHPFLNSTAWYISTTFLLSFLAFFLHTLQKIRVATKRLRFLSTAFLPLPASDCSSEFDATHYTLDTLQLPNSLLSNLCLPPISQTCRATPFPPKTWSVIISTQTAGIKIVCYRSSTFEIITPFLRIIYIYDLIWTWIYYYDLIQWFLISGYVLKNMLLVRFGKTNQNLPYFDQSVAYGW